MHRLIVCLGLLLVVPLACCAAADDVIVRQAEDHLLIETDALEARINTKGYVSGTARQGLLDKQSGARDQGFGLHVMDFLLAPGRRDDGYMDSKHHGRIEKHYVEGPQVCTQARTLRPDIVRGAGFAAVRFRFTFNQPGQGYQAGSTWQQTLVFLPGKRYFLSAERITSANTVDNLFYRIDMPGHLKHSGGDTFTKVWLSYLGELSPADFAADFAPDERFLYQRQPGQIPQRMIRAYQVQLDGRPGPWLAGMTLEPGAVSEAWCHQRGYICFIQELHQRPVRAGESFGAAYVVGWFDDRAEMERTYDLYRGTTGIDVEPAGVRLNRGG